MKDRKIHVRMFVPDGSDRHRPYSDLTDGEQLAFRSAAAVRVGDAASSFLTGVQGAEVLCGTDS